MVTFRIMFGMSLSNISKHNGNVLSLEESLFLNKCQTWAHLASAFWECLFAESDSPTRRLMP